MINTKQTFIIALLSILIISNKSYSQNTKSISDTDLDSAITSIENYLNNVIQKSQFGIISVNEWNPSYHNGYSPKCTMYSLNTYPYEVFKEKDPLIKKNKIIISINSDKTKIIINLFWDNTFYSFYTDLILSKNGYKIQQIPYGLHEGD